MQLQSDNRVDLRFAHAETVIPFVALMGIGKSRNNHGNHRTDIGIYHVDHPWFQQIIIKNTLSIQISPVRSNHSYRAFLLISLTWKLNCRRRSCLFRLSILARTYTIIFFKYLTEIFRIREPDHIGNFRYCIFALL